MVLKDEETSKYYSCVFLLKYLTNNKVTPIARAELSMPAAIANPTIFVPIAYHEDQQRLSIVVSNAIKANVYTYTTHKFGAEPISGTTVATPEEWRNILILYSSIGNDFTSLHKCQFIGNFQLLL
jgi:hypothetical protein